MHELTLVFMIILVSTAAAVALVLISGRFLKLRRERAPEAVDPAAYRAKYLRAETPSAGTEHKLAA
jgi:hypothetical protein